MSETPQNPFEPFFDEIRRIVREEIHALDGGLNGHGDRLLSVEEAAGLLDVSPEWIYHNHKKLPFVVKLGPKMLKFSLIGIQKFILSKRS